MNLTKVNKRMSVGKHIETQSQLETINLEDDDLSNGDLNLNQIATSPAGGNKNYTKSTTLKNKKFKKCNSNSSSDSSKIIINSTSEQTVSQSDTDSDYTNDSLIMDVSSLDTPKKKKIVYNKKKQQQLQKQKQKPSNLLQKVLQNIEKSQPAMTIRERILEWQKLDLVKGNENLISDSSPSTSSTNGHSIPKNYTNKRRTYKTLDDFSNTDHNSLSLEEEDEKGKFENNGEELELVKEDNDNDDKESNNVGLSLNDSSDVEILFETDTSNVQSPTNISIQKKESNGITVNPIRETAIIDVASSDTSSDIKLLWTDSSSTSDFRSSLKIREIDKIRMECRKQHNNNILPHYLYGEETNKSNILLRYNYINKGINKTNNRPIDDNCFKIPKIPNQKYNENEQQQNVLISYLCQRHRMQTTIPLSGSPDTKEELYKYLKIDTNRNIKQEDDDDDQDEDEENDDDDNKDFQNLNKLFSNRNRHEFNRRSLRVKLQRICTNNIVQINKDLQKETEKSNLLINSTTNDEINEKDLNGFKGFSPVKNKTNKGYFNDIKIENNEDVDEEISVGTNGSRCCGIIVNDQTDDNIIDRLTLPTTTISSINSQQHNNNNKDNKLIKFSYGNFTLNGRLKNNELQYESKTNLNNVKSLYQCKQLPNNFVQRFIPTISVLERRNYIIKNNNNNNSMAVFTDDKSNLTSEQQLTNLEQQHSPATEGQLTKTTKETTTINETTSNEKTPTFIDNNKISINNNLIKHPYKNNQKIMKKQKLNQQTTKKQKHKFIKLRSQRIQNYDWVKTQLRSGKIRNFFNFKNNSNKITKSQQDKLIQPSSSISLRRRYHSQQKILRSKSNLTPNKLNKIGKKIKINSMEKKTRSNAIKKNITTTTTILERKILKENSVIYPSENNSLESIQKISEEIKCGNIIIPSLNSPPLSTSSLNEISNFSSDLTTIEKCSITHPAFSSENEIKYSLLETLVNEDTVNNSFSIKSEIIKEQLNNNSMINPLNPIDGEIIAAYYLNNNLIIVQDEQISYWKLNHTISLLNHTQKWILIGKCERKQHNVFIPVQKQKQIGFYENNIFYLELRARIFHDDKRECFLSSVYSNVYFKNHENKITMKSIQFDTLHGTPIEMCYVILKNSRYCLVSWFERTPSSCKSGLCKYSLAPDFETLACMREFPSVNHQITTLHELNDEQLLGIGNSEVTIWDHKNGDLLINIDLKDSLGFNLTGFMCKDEVENYLFLVQLKDLTKEEKLMQIFSIRLTSSQEMCSWKIIESYRVPATFDVPKNVMISNNILISTFEDNSSFLIKLNDLEKIYINHHHHHNSNLNSKKIFPTNDYILEIDESLLVKSLSEYLLDVNLR